MEISIKTKALFKQNNKKELGFHTIWWKVKLKFGQTVFLPMDLSD